MAGSRRKRGSAQVPRAEGDDLLDASTSPSGRVAWNTVQELFDQHLSFIEELLRSGECLGDVRLVVTQLGIVDPKKVIGINEVQAGLLDPAVSGGTDMLLKGFIEQALRGEMAAMSALETVMDVPSLVPDVMSIIAPVQLSASGSTRYLSGAEQRQFRQRLVDGTFDDNDAVLIQLHWAGGVAEGLVKFDNTGGVKSVWESRGLARV